MYCSPYQAVLSRLNAGDGTVVNESYPCRNSGRTLLMVAAMEADMRAITVLVEMGVDLDAQDANGFTALMYAARDGHYNAVKRLLDAGCNPLICSRHGYCAILGAAQNGFYSVVELLSLYVSVDTADEDGVTPLMCACLNNHARVVSLLLQLGADPNRKNHMGRTAAMIALLHRRVESVSVLLHHGVHVCVEMNDCTVPAVFYSAFISHYRLCELFLCRAEYISEFIGFLMKSPSQHVENVTLECICEIAHFQSWKCCREISDTIVCHSESLLEVLIYSFSSEAKVPLYHLLDVVVWCIRCLKALNHNDLACFEFFWHYVENLVEVLSFIPLRFASAYPYPENDSGGQISSEELSCEGACAIGHASICSLTTRRVKLLFAMMELYCVGLGTFSKDPKTGLLVCYSPGKRVVHLLESNSAFMRELVLAYPSLFSRMVFFSASAESILF